MTAEPAAAGRREPAGSTRPLPGPYGHADDGLRLLRLPGGEPRPRPQPATAISVRRTVGLPDRVPTRARSAARRVLRAAGWGLAATIIAGGSLMLHQMLFSADSEASAWLSRSSASLTGVGTDALRPLTNEDPDLPAKHDLVARLQPVRSTAPAPGADAVVVDGSHDVSTEASSSDDSSGSGSSAGSGGASDGDSSGTGSGTSDDSSGGGSGGGDNSSGHGSGGGDDSSGHGSGGSDDSSGHGSDDSSDRPAA